MQRTLVSEEVMHQRNDSKLAGEVADLCMPITTRPRQRGRPASWTPIEFNANNAARSIFAPLGMRSTDGRDLYFGLVKPMISLLLVGDELRLTHGGETYTGLLVAVMYDHQTRQYYLYVFLEEFGAVHRFSVQAVTDLGPHLAYPALEQHLADKVHELVEGPPKASSSYVFHLQLLTHTHTQAPFSSTCCHCGSSRDDGR